MRNKLDLKNNIRNDFKRVILWMSWWINLEIKMKIKTCQNWININRLIDVNLID
jgi:hypothetical protein